MIGRNTLSNLEDAITYASSYEEYREACEAHDELSGADEWKAKDPCKLVSTGIWRNDRKQFIERISSNENLTESIWSNEKFISLQLIKWKIDWCKM